MVAHEIRNPLNAILQSADMIRISMEGMQQDRIQSLLMNETLDSARTIEHCALHQKVINRILTYVDVSGAD